MRGSGTVQSRAVWAEIGGGARHVNEEEECIESVAILEVSPMPQISGCRFFRPCKVDIWRDLV